MTMQRRHFELIAEAIQELGDVAIRPFMARHFASKLAATNPNFNRARFLRACGVGD